MEREFKDSGIEWIGRIPKEWKTTEIKRIMRNKSVRNKPEATVLSLYRDYGIVPKDSRDDNFNVTSDDTTNYKFVEIGDFVINKMKAWQGSMAVSEYEGIISPAYYVCSFIEDEIDRKYIHYLLRNESYKPEYMRLSTGLRIGQWDLGIDDFMKIPVVIPSTNEQHRIANYLDKKCGEIDELIALQEQMIAQLTDYKQSVITEAVTKGLNPDAEFVPSGIDWIGDVPKDWKLQRLKYLCTIQTGNQDTQDSDSTGIYPFYVRSPIVERSNKYSFEGEGILMAGDGAGAGRVFHHVYGKYAVHQRVYRFANIKGVDSIFLFYFLNCLFCKEMDRGSAQSTVPSVRLPMLQNFIICLPSFEEQIDITKYLDTKCSDIDSLIAIKQLKIETLKDYKKSVIYECVTEKTDIV